MGISNCSYSKREWRSLCVHIRSANAAIKRENHPLPTMDKLLPQVRDAKYFSKLDVRDAFHELELYSDSRHITMFITSQGLFRYKRLMFRMTCAPKFLKDCRTNLIRLWWCNKFYRWHRYIWKGHGQDGKKY